MRRRAAQQRQVRRVHPPPCVARIGMDEVALAGPTYPFAQKPLPACGIKWPLPHAIPFPAFLSTKPPAPPMKNASFKFNRRMTATAVFPTSEQPAEEVLRELSLPPYKAVFVVIGAADTLAPEVVPRLTQLFNRGIAPAAIEASAVIVDGGTQAGVMRLMGEGLASRGATCPLVGVAPASLVMHPDNPTAGAPLEPNHSHFVLVEGDAWGSETATLFELVRALVNNQAEPSPVATRVPAVVVLAGGGAIALQEVLCAVRQKLPLVVVEGSGGTADAVAAAWKTRGTTPDDPDLAEIVADGALQLFPLFGPVQGLSRLLARELGADQVLLQAWETFADYDLNANRQQRHFDRLQQLIIGVGLISTGLVISQEVYGPKQPGTTLPRYSGWWFLHHVLILIPITLTILINSASRFNQGNKWLLLRAGAEGIKREIYRYRARAMPLQDAGTPEAELALRMAAITRATMGSVVNSTSLVPYDKSQGFPPGMYGAQGGDDGFSYLAPARYLDVRLGDQLAYFRRKAVRLETQYKALSWLTFIVGGTGTYLAAIDQTVWVAVTLALATAIGTYLGYRRTEGTLTKYNQTATDLSNIRSGWNALRPEDQLNQLQINQLVNDTERVLQSEHDDWGLDMTSALAKLSATPTKAFEREDNPGLAAGKAAPTPGPAMGATQSAAATAAQATAGATAAAEVASQAQPGNDTLTGGAATEGQEAAGETEQESAPEEASGPETTPDPEANEVFVDETIWTANANSSN